MTDDKIKNNTLVLHTCCAVCMCYPNYAFMHNIYSETEIDDVIYYFYNPNINPKEEYDRRKKEFAEYAQKVKVKIAIEDGNRNEWNDFIKGFENEPEKGMRCEKCFELRLSKTFEFAKKIAAFSVATVMTVSPHKDSKMIERIGKTLEKKYEMKYTHIDFKKKDGFFHAGKIAKEENLYRQNYCGCKYSMRKTILKQL